MPTSSSYKACSSPSAAVAAAQSAGPSPSLQRPPTSHLRKSLRILHRILNGRKHSVAAIAESADAQYQRQRGPVGQVSGGAGRKAAREERVGHLSAE